MELEELKTAWASVDERLKKQEILKESIIKEMIYSKANKSLKKLFLDESISILLLLLLIPFLVYAYGKFGGKNIWWDTTVIGTVVFCIVYSPFLIYKVFILMKIDISENIKDNLFNVNRYKILKKREKNGTIILGPLLYILVCLVFVKLKANIVLWTFWICILVFFILYSYWYYNKFCKKNIQSIQKSLEELEELKELDTSKN